MVDRDPNKTLVLRNPRGQVIWRLPGNTPEQNEKLGIRNFQGLFLENFPVFNELYPKKDGKLPEDQRRAASQFVYKAVTDEKFRQLMLSVCSRVSTPYFKGSYAKAAQKSFESWGVEVVVQTVGTRSRLVGLIRY